MAVAVVTVAAGGRPVVDVTATNPGLGMPVTEATNGYGIAVTKVSLAVGGLPVTYFSGGAAAAPYPPSDLTAWPDASNTGVPAGTSLTAQSGDITTTANGQTIDKIALTGGTIIVNHTGVTIQRCSLTTTGTYNILINPAGTGCTVQDCTITGAQTGIQGFGTFKRNNITSVENAIVIANGSNTTAKDNFIHDLFQAGADPHYDGIAMQGGCNNIQILHNWITGTPGTGIQGVFLTAEFGAANTIAVTNNYIAECSYPITCGVGLTVVSVTNNVLKEGSAGFYNFTAVGMTVSGNVSTRGYYLDAGAPAAVGTVAFTPSNLITAGADQNINTGFRVGATLAQPIAAEFRITLYSGSTAAMGLESVWFGKASSGQTATAALSPVLFGGSASPLSNIATSRYVVSDWMTTGLSFPAASIMLIGFALRNPGGTGLAVTNTNANSYFGATGNVALANPSYTTSGGTCYALARIETR